MSTRYVIERQDGETECEHPLCDTLHRRFHVHTKGGVWFHPVSYPAWHVWDIENDNYLGGGPHEFSTHREAKQALAAFLETGSFNPGI